MQSRIEAKATHMQIAPSLPCDFDSREPYPQTGQAENSWKHNKILKVKWKQAWIQLSFDSAQRAATVSLFVACSIKAEKIQWSVPLQSA